MRILFLTHRLPYAPNRGDRIRAYYLLREMSRFAEVSLFSLVHDDDEAAQVERVPFAKHTVGVRVPRMRNYLQGASRWLSSRPLTHSLLDAPDAHAAIGAMVRAAPPDLVVAYCSGMARFAMEPPLQAYPFVLDMVDVDSAKWRQLASFTRGPRRWIYAREARTLGAFEATACGRARQTLIVNERERQTLLAAAPGANVTVLPNGIDVEGFTPPGPPAAAPIVIFCGVMSYYPNEEGVRWFAQDVWPRVRAARPDARFVVVGTAPTSAVQQLAASDASIEIAGHVPQVQPYLWKSAVAVAPLRMARGLQNKVLEALAAGLPIVATSQVMDGIPQEAAPGCVTANDPAEFAAAVVRLLALSPQERRQQVAAARLEQLTWSEQLRPLERLLLSALNAPAAKHPAGSGPRHG